MFEPQSADPSRTVGLPPGPAESAWLEATGLLQLHLHCLHLSHAVHPQRYLHDTHSVTDRGRVPTFGSIHSETTADLSHGTNSA